MGSVGPAEPKRQHENDSVCARGRENPSFSFTDQSGEFAVNSGTFN